MQIHFGVDLFLAEWPESVVCVGTFDGVHLGHAEVINQAVGRARLAGMPSVLVTFDRHPAATLNPAKKPPSISTLSQNLKAFESLGVDTTVILKFDENLANTNASDFLTSVLRDKLNAVEIVIGHDFAFGKGREGDGEWLSSRLPTTIVPAFLHGEDRISSSNIRRSILNGDVHAANVWLGRPYCLEAVVVHGDKVGRTLGFPTANLARATDQVIPSHGIYAGKAKTIHGEYLAAISVGVRPTFGVHNTTIEAYLLDYPGESLYGSSLSLELYSKLRNEIKFDSVDSLKAQMATDVVAVRSMI